IVVALLLRRQLTSGRPGRLQSAFEMIIEFVDGLIKDTPGGQPIRIAPLAISLFVFLLFANWWGLLPFFGLKSQFLFKSPTNDVNVAFALAIMSIVLLHVYSVRFRGGGGYVKHYFSVVEPSWRNPFGAL